MLTGSIRISPVLKVIVMDQAFNLDCEWTRLCKGLTVDIDNLDIEFGFRLVNKSLCSQSVES